MATVFRRCYHDDGSHEVCVAVVACFPPGVVNSDHRCDGFVILLWCLNTFTWKSEILTVIAPSSSDFWNISDKAEILIHWVSPGCHRHDMPPLLAMSVISGYQSIPTSRQIGRIRTVTPKRGDRWDKCPDAREGRRPTWALFFKPHICVYQ